MKAAVVNEAPVGLQSRGPTKPQRESSPVSHTKQITQITGGYLLTKDQPGLEGRDSE